MYIKNKDMKNFISTVSVFLFFFVAFSSTTKAQEASVEKKIFFKIYLAAEVAYTIEDANTIDHTFNNSMFIYSCKTDIQNKITELHATDGLNRGAIIDLLSYTGKGYKVARIDEFEE